MKIRTYVLGGRGIRIALLTDLHNMPWEEILALVEKEAPAIIAIAGDLAFHYTKHHRIGGFLRRCAEIAPTFVSLGNHDTLEERRFSQAVMTSGASILNNGYVDTQISGLPVRIGGLTAPDTYRNKKRTKPTVGWLRDFSDCEIFKILLCHRPEFYPQYLAKFPIDLVLSGHTHGGQWRIGNQGVFSTGQGLFPRLSGGVKHYDKCSLVISRGLSNTTWIPRFFNPREIVVVEI